MLDVREMAKGMLKSACFLGMTERGEPTFSQATFNVAENYCKLFVQAAKDDIELLMRFPQFWERDELPVPCETLLGHCLWVDACDYGCGFDAGCDLPSDLVVRLIWAARDFSELAGRWHVDNDYFVLNGPSEELMKKYGRCKDGVFEYVGKMEALC